MLNFGKKKETIRKLKKLLLELSEKSKKMGQNIMEISIKCAHEGITTGEWSNVMRETYGEYRANWDSFISYNNKR